MSLNGPASQPKPGWDVEANDRRAELLDSFISLYYEDMRSCNTSTWKASQPISYLDKSQFKMFEPAETHMSSSFSSYLVFQSQLSSGQRDVLRCLRGPDR